jgi:hypothetical protein
MQVRWLALVFALACKKPAPAAMEASAPVDVFAVDESGLRLKGPIPIADGSAAMQRGDDYGALRFGNATIGPNGLVVHLTDKPLACNQWPDHKDLSLSLYLGAGPDGKFFAGRTVTTHINGTRGFGHLKLEPFTLATNAHVVGRIAFSDPPWTHNGFAPKPERAAGTFDVTLCPFADADKAALVPPADLVATAPLASEIDGARSSPKSVLVTVQWDEPDALPWVSDVEAYERAGVTCETRYGKNGADMKVAIGLVPSDLGVDQPLRFHPDGSAAHTQRESHVGWIRVEPFDPVTATTAKGAVVAFAPRYDTAAGATTPEHLPPASLAGTFEARVCRLGSKLGKPYE